VQRRSVGHWTVHLSRLFHWGVRVYWNRLPLHLLVQTVKAALVIEQPPGRPRVP
jgi:hypothetical protein